MKKKEPWQKLPAGGRYPHLTGFGGRGGMLCGIFQHHLLSPEVGGGRRGVNRWIGASTNICLNPVVMGADSAELTIGLLLILVLLLLAALIYMTLHSRKLSRRAQDRLREKVSQDFHDELGSKFTIITLYSELTRKAIDNNSGNAKSYLDKIGQTSSELYGSMKDLIWSLDPAADSLHDLGQRLHATAEELFEETDINFEVQMLQDEREQVLPLDFKRHILLIFKEAMHNALRHADCTAVRLQFEREGGRLKVSLWDNGNGFDPTKTGRGEGLKNMKNRAFKLGGDLDIRSVDRGTEVLLYCPWPGKG